jgi:23S rRNA pseudouridine2457 synthase
MTLLLFNKPFGVLCQFTDPEGRPTLADYLKTDGIYAAGRLDRDSEGLVLLTDDGKLQHRLTRPSKKSWKRYWVEVENTPDESALKALQQGVMLKDGPTLPAQAKCIRAPQLWPRDPPIRFRANIPTQWLEIALQEGRNRQIRRMTASVGYPTLRLVRIAIGPWRLKQLQPGEWVKVATKERNVQKQHHKKTTRC